jgi:hypothetical protein
MGVDANANLIYGFVEPDNRSSWHEMEDVDGDDYEKWEKVATDLNIYTGHMGDGPRYIAAAYFGTTHRWVETIEPEKMVVKPEWDANLRTYAKAVNIDLGDAKPQWTLMAYFD